MRKPLTAEVLEWPERPTETPVGVELTCEKCGADLIVPAATGVRVLASNGMAMIHDTTPPVPHGMPARVRCPRCLTTYTL